ncbi:M20/M25/M40 family metallo-hydrolase, partial [bacterium]|nr:M20/M25/M40 family metallo-hydrolase [bacterium]
MANNILLRDEISKRLRASQERLIELTSHLVRIDTQNPPGRTGTIVKTVAEILQSVDGIELESCISEEPIVNLVARIRGRSSGRRLIFNGHLDTYPIGDSSLWSVDPFDAELKGGKLYGRGTADMKGGISCSLVAFETLADFRDAWSGELVVTLAGDEETMGRLGTGYLLENVPHAKGEAMICGDVGSPKIIWFGEKGMIWLDVFAVGRAAHGAHVHKGRNAIECLFEALQRLIKLRKHPVRTPVEVANAIDNSKH